MDISGRSDGVFCAGRVLERCGDVCESVDGGDDSEHMEKKEGNTDKHRFIIITLLIYFNLSPTPAKMPPTQYLSKYLNKILTIG